MCYGSKRVKVSSGLPANFTGSVTLSPGSALTALLTFFVMRVILCNVQVDALSKRKERSNPSFDEDSVRELNHYFANLCHDEDYIRPVPMDITENIPAPQLTLSQVYYALLKTKQTSTGPDNIPFWVWKENAAILAPAVQAIWNLSLSTQRWPSAWRQANVYPLPKVDIPVQPRDFRGISVTPVIARTFEQVVYNTFRKEGVESYLNNNQFAYRTGGSCTNALLKIQHEFRHGFFKSL